MKLQELLNKHKDNLWDWLGVPQIDNIARDNHQTIIIDLRINNEPATAFSLSDLLFSTPFLSLLEWKDNWLESRKHFCVWFVSYGCSSYNYHKINLVLLTTDEERVKYIEVFTL